MVRIDAGTATTEVIHHEAGGYRASVHLIVVAVSRDLLAISALQGIALNTQISLPDPAARGRIDPIVDRREILDELPWIWDSSLSLLRPAASLRFAYRLALALSARAVASSSDRVGRGERMTADAVRLRLAASGDRVTPQRVLLAAYRLKVLGVHAARVTTEVIELQTGRDWASQALIVDAVGVLHMPTMAHTSIPTACY
jgi:hypothetical protein